LHCELCPSLATNCGALTPLQIIMLTVYEDRERIFRALKAGADGYLSNRVRRRCCSRPLTICNAALRRFPVTLPEKSCATFTSSARREQESENLSPRELEVLNLLSSGYLYTKISDQLGIGLETVRTYVNNICEKMHVRNRVQAVARHRGKTVS